MSESDVIKGVSTLKSMAENILSVITFCENNNISELMPYIDELNNGCSILTNIMEKAFSDLIVEKERLEDDGK